jgi:hypothetical protein
MDRWKALALVEGAALAACAVAWPVIRLRIRLAVLNDIDRRRRARIAGQLQHAVWIAQEGKRRETHHD